MTDAEIVKAFDCCYTDRYPDCTECPRYNREKEGCMDVGNGNIYDLPKAMIDLINRQQATINNLKAENRNSGQKILNQRKQLKACNEKIKRLEVDIEKLKRLEFQADALNEAISVFCNKYCRYPLECRSQEELDGHCDNCDFIKILNLKEGEKENGKLHRT